MSVWYEECVQRAIKLSKTHSDLSMDFRNVDTHQTKHGGARRPDRGSKVSVWYEECAQHAIRWSKTHYDLSMDF